MNTQLRLIAAAVAALAVGQVSAQTYGNPDYSRSGYGYGHGRTQTVRCESVHSRRTYCRVDIQGTVRLTRQLSRNACVRGSTWATNSRGIWVSRGCRADFAISPRHQRYWNDGGQASNGYDQRDYNNDGYSDNNDGDRNDNGYDRASYGQTVRCQSTNDGRTYCSNQAGGNIRLARTYRGQCMEGQTWGSDQRGIWVSGDCDASFSIDPDSNDDSGYYQR